MRAFVFPGQGSQKVGMGADLADASRAAREVFEEVDDALGQALARLMRGGPEDELTLTANAQPAIMANAIATLAVLEQEFGVSLAEKGDCVAGHSLGEYTALCAVGAFSLADTARLLKLRGHAMQDAVQEHDDAVPEHDELYDEGVALLLDAASHGATINLLVDHLRRTAPIRYTGRSRDANPSPPRSPFVTRPRRPGPRE